MVYTKIIQRCKGLLATDIDIILFHHKYIIDCQTNTPDENYFQECL